jgi:hypothetical protein
VVALVGVALSYAAVLAGVAGATDANVADETTAGALCVLGAEACRADSPPPGAAALDDDAVYATPAEVDCRALAPADLRGAARGSDRVLLSGDCESAPLDLRYRVSRFPDSERSQGAFRSERARRTVRAAAVVAGLPLNTAALMTATAHPMALYAEHALVPPAARELDFEPPAVLHTRSLDPPDRPPRV